MTFEGEFIEGEIEGEGKTIFNIGDNYSGHFSKSKFHGYGHYKYFDGLEVNYYITIVIDNWIFY